MNARTIDKGTYPTGGVVGKALFVLLLSFGPYPELPFIPAPKWVVDVIYTLFLLFGVWLFATCDGFGVRSLNPGKIWGKHDGWLMLAIFVCAFAATILCSVYLPSSQPDLSPPLLAMIREIRALSPYQFVLYTVGWGILIGVTEEILFRGYLITRLRHGGLSDWSSVLLSAAAFGLSIGQITD